MTAVVLMSYSVFGFSLEYMLWVTKGLFEKNALFSSFSLAARDNSTGIRSRSDSVEK